MNTIKTQLSIEQQAEEYRNIRLYKSQANTVLNKMKSIKKHLAEKRWMWELLQNASDYNKTVDVRITLNHDSLIFEHNGHPFKYTDAMNLIVPDSDKNSVDEEGKQKIDTVGQFGTGFISTHILGLKIKVKGDIIGSGDICMPFNFTLHRQNWHDKKEIIKSMGIAENEFEKYISNTPRKYERRFSTSFEYCFDYPFDKNFDSKDIAIAGFEQLDLLLPYVLSFVSNITTVTINNNIDNTSKVYKVDNRDELSSNINIVDVNANHLSKPKKYLLVKEGDTIIAWHFHVLDGKNYLLPIDKSIPKLFFSFPLVGSHNFCFPTIINNSNKNEWIPRTEREGVDLDEEDDSGKKNRKVIENAGKAYLRLIEYVTDKEWNNLHLLTKMPSFDFEKENIKEWFKKSIWKGIRIKLLDSKIVQTDTGRIKLSQLLLPFHEANDEGFHQESITNLYQLVSKFDKKHKDSELSIKDRLPLIIEQENLIQFWSNTLDFKRFPNLKYTWSNLIEDVSNEASISALDEKIDGDAWEWMNTFIDNLKVFGYEFSTIKQPIFPNQEQSGIFYPKIELYSDETINLLGKEKEIIKDLLALTGKNIRKDIIHENVISTIIDDDERCLALDTDFILPINTFIENRPFETSKKLILALISYIPKEESQKEYRTTIYQLAKVVFGQLMPMIQSVNGFPESLWEEADKMFLEHIAELIAGLSLKELIIKLPHLKENETALDWHQTFIGLIANEKYRKLIETKALLPNQEIEGNFKLLDSNFFLDDNLQEPLKIGLAIFGEKFDWRKQLLDIRYSVYFLEEDIRKLFFGNRYKDNKKASERINYIIQNRKKEGYDSADINSVLLYLIKYTYANESLEDEKRKQLYYFAAYLFPNIEDRQVTYLIDLEWSDIENSFLIFLAQKIALIGSQIIDDEANSITFLSEYINSHRENDTNVIIWLKQFITFLEQHDIKLLDEWALLPNCYGNFDLAANLKSDFDRVGEDGKGIKSIPKELLDALAKIAIKPLENWNTILLHPEFSFPLIDYKTTAKVCTHIESLLTDGGRGHREDKTIQEGVLLVKDFIDNLEELERSKLFPRIHQNIYKMALSAMGEVAQYASKIPKDILKGLSENKEMQKKWQVMNNMSSSTIEKISNNPQIVEQIEQISSEDLEGLSKDRKQYIFQEAMKLLGIQGNDYSELRIKLPTSILTPSTNQTNDYHKRLGRWGEEYINTLLKKKKEIGEIYSYDWLNEFGENFTSHDFEIITSDGAEKIYMDVKATEKDKDFPIPISDRQWTRIFKHRENYVIYRVFNADLNTLAENNTLAGFFEFEPYERMVGYVRERIEQLCRKSTTNSVRMDRTYSPPNRWPNL